MSATTKTPYAEIHPIAARLLDALRPYCHRIEIAGSLRRKRDMIGDIEIVAIPRRPRNLLGEELPNAPTALDQFLTEREVEFMRNGPRYKQFTAAVPGRWMV